ncbi:MAG: dephospho-CoA kinase [Fusobacteriia bacterium 4572_132]|nr:MAG: dephospho-CoA kinase [Fusobacteriia bacterium 4572_132]
MVLGLTGGIATGKSTVSKMMEEKYNVKVIDVDEVGKKVMSQKSILKKLSESFEENIIKNGELDRKKMREIVFNNNQKRAELNKITHTAILEETDRIIEEYKKVGNEIIIVDMPLLFEVGYDKKVDKVILVYCKKDIEIKRLMNRDEILKEDALKMINSQMDLEEKQKRADIVIKNNTNLEDLENEIKKVIDRIKA